MKLLSWILGLPFLLLIGIYKYVLSPFTPPSCRHTPTCSSYASEAVQEWGPLRGSYMALRRISRCHPWGSHGFDPVPKRSEIEN
ncbi:MAG: membrane protein insertion efficiency factor YidD [Schleiferiaceae bacterium]|nr:membrane protein insertion efficiency factor YidD [Schleiferiaceae bacterium]